MRGPDSAWLRLIARHYIPTDEMRDRMNRIADRLELEEALAELTRAEMDRIEKERPL